MTNGAAKVLVLDCVSFEQNVWCSNGMGDKYATKVRWELHLLVPSSSRIFRSGGRTCALTVNRRQRRTHKYETVRAVLLVHTLATRACNCQIEGEDWTPAGTEKAERVRK